MLETIPYRPLTRLLREIRIRYYTHPWPDEAPSITIEDDAESFEDLLRNWFDFEGMLLSYRYEGEVVNLRRPAGEGTKDRQQEIHLRARPVDGEDALEVIAHREASRYEHKRAHIDEVDLRWLSEDELEAVITTGRLDAPDEA
ncbi:hypothetical protein [Natrinema pallidum]|uniref:hypothetical protein n=1 Tax=Natrinema pallidum TaxID=69527 RepID=UPI003750C405